MSDVSDRLLILQRRMATAAQSAGRPVESVHLIAVSKTFGADAVREAHNAGQIAFGENYLQEALTKIEALHDLPLEWHFIGPIQSNKTADIAAHFSWAHGVEREKIARRLSEQRPAHLPPLNVCVQVNVSGEASKSGVRADEALALCETLAGLPRLRLRGLMTIPEPDRADARAPYKYLRELFESLRRSGLELDTLSAGMSDDFEAAIAEGATHIRIGTALFGKRT
ncbi:MAG: YggS family pyridoxal phosphate-dependent enzyme [Pseudomonadota bacterium]